MGLNDTFAQNCNANVSSQTDGRAEGRAGGRTGGKGRIDIGQKLYTPRHTSHVRGIMKEFHINRHISF